MNATTWTDEERDEIARRVQGALIEAGRPDLAERMRRGTGEWSFSPSLSVDDARLAYKAMCLVYDPQRCFDCFYGVVPMPCPHREVS